ncbi:MAG: hypothetical protein H7843_10445 [Nitrospirota bacterium]
MGSKWTCTCGESNENGINICNSCGQNKAVKKPIAILATVVSVVLVLGIATLYYLIKQPERQFEEIVKMQIDNGTVSYEQLIKNEVIKKAKTEHNIPDDKAKSIIETALNALPPQQPINGVKTTLKPNVEAEKHFYLGITFANAAKSTNTQKIKEENLSNAYKEFTDAINIDPNYALAYANRASVLMLQKKFNKAETDLIKAKELAPNDPNIRYNLVCVYSLLNKTDMALDELDTALKNGFKGETALTALRTDSDLDNLRKFRKTEYKHVLEKNNIYIIK